MTSKNRYGNYHYDDPDHVHAVTRIEADATTIDSYAYDANGNMTSGAGRTLTYDYDNRPTSITYNGMAVVSIYDANGNRVKKITPTSTTTYIEQLYECKDGECTKYIFAGSQRIANTKGTETYYYHTDHLGSSSIMTDSSGNTAQDIYYYPYGDIKTNTGSEVAKHKFTGQEYDAETGLYYYGARYYDPKLARFISADTIVPDPLNPQALNRYSYVINNPLKYIDPTGHGFFSWLEDTIQDGIDWINDRIDDALEWLGLEDVNFNAGGGMSTDSRGNTDTWGWNPSTDERFSSGPGSVVGSHYPTLDSLDPMYYRIIDTSVDLEYAGADYNTMALDIGFGIRTFEDIERDSYMVADASGGVYVDMPENIPSWIIMDPASVAGGPLSIRNAGKGLLSKSGIGNYLFRKGGLLNSNRYLRIGYGRQGGNWVFRMSGKWVKILPDKWHDNGHIILKNIGKIR